MSKNFSYFKELSYYSSLGFSFVISILLGFFFGRFLDGKFGTHPILTFIFLALGIAAGFRNLWYTAKKINSKKNGNTNKNI